MINPGTPLDMVEDITMYDRVRLQELGIDSFYDRIVKSR